LRLSLCLSLRRFEEGYQLRDEGASELGRREDDGGEGGWGGVTTREMRFVEVCERAVAVRAGDPGGRVHRCRCQRGRC
jgi:hypothetical protein